MVAGGGGTQSSLQPDRPPRVPPPPPHGHCHVVIANHRVKCFTDAAPCEHLRGA